MWRSTPMRQAVLLVIAVAVVMAATLGGAFLKMRADLRADIAHAVRLEMAGLDIAATPGALATLVAARARASDPRETVFAFLGSGGQRAGNARAVLGETDVTLHPLSASQPLGEAGYLHEIRRLSGGVLVVAKSLAPVERLRDVFLTLLAFSMVPTVLFSLGIGAWLARRGARRVARIEEALARMGAGDLSARVAVVGDDDLARVGRGVNRMAQKQEAATEALKQVSSDIAHDLRTPLQRIGVMLEDLAVQLPEGGAAAVLADQARGEAARAVDVFRALLQIAQIEAGSPATRFGPVDLCEVAARMAELYEPSAEDMGATLRFDRPGAPVLVQGDEGLLGQALANLIENALRHAGPAAQVRVSVAQGPEGAVLSVSDNGPGIPEGERDKVLRRLYRLERSRTTPGNGLGLSLVQAVAQVHGARLLLENAGGDGGQDAPGLAVSIRFAPGEGGGGLPA
ncbi:HAMP domain-containing sensor histidine kinase [Rhodalgimonas zhirmunskyi]|uniref:histidine kinase n=1 Tax=Rhodalgimonas zhirmunskyi TaxID=2964767 RepID=A0AAJ1UAB6_9RHOB|nr:HAMP domain-containing sensor histidine kinase [Rhodoalgimonas zhirmunskyi]MDQ2095720.1 HAMP domain-containing histidine kinase [Rhodoalgimonas zhirmunskyi]